MVVMKFGGSSMGNAEAIGQAASIVGRYESERPVVVVSALFGVTDLLIAAGEAARKGDGRMREERYGEIAAKHLAAGSPYGQLREVEERLLECREVLHGAACLKELSPRTGDLLLSFGERLSAAIVSAALRHAGLEAEYADARGLIETDDRFGSANVDLRATKRKAREALLPILEAGRIPVVTGFIGATPDGETTTLGRGGSDYTATLLAEALDAEEAWIWKDVEGIFSADPRVVSNARLLGRLSYEEAAEMSYFGAKVLHPLTMVPAQRSGIPIRIKCTFDPDAPGTLICEGTGAAGEGVRSVNAMKRLAMVTVEGKGMAGIAGFAAHVFGTAGALRINILMFTQSSSEQAICLIVPKDDGEALRSALERELREEVANRMVDAISVRAGIAAVAVVGEGMRGRVGIAGNVFSAVADAGINVLAIAQGSSERNISFIVEEDRADDAVRALHEAFELAEAKEGAPA